MMKSVWLSGLIVSSLNDAGSVLFSYYRHLRDAAGAERAMMVLTEPDDGERTYFLLSPRAACLTPEPGIRADESVLAEVMRKKASAFDGDRLCCPLYYENISSFGALVFEGAAGDTDMGRLNEALVAFSMVLYSESMGSILRSYHDTVMRVEDLCVDYAQGRRIYRAVDRVSLDVCEKEFTVIVGASGSGKSSLLNVMGGMLTAAEGSVLWKGRDISRMTEKERTAYRGGTVGFVFQRYNLIGDLTAEENISLAASLVKDPLPAAEVLEMVGMKDRAKDYPSRMSGGEQQRVCIARALVKKAKLLLCDEPTGALDTENARHVITILQNIAKDQGIPVVMITHNPNLVVLADHCITISNGKIADDRLQPFALRAADLKLL